MTLGGTRAYLLQTARAKVFDRRHLRDADLLAGDALDVAQLVVLTRLDERVQGIEGRLDRIIALLERSARGSAPATPAAPRPPRTKRPPAVERKP